jgi:hypothetical protein
LLTFNGGVEIGQLLTIAAAWLVVVAVRRFPVLAQARVAVLYAIGTTAAYWACTRAAVLLT